MWKDCERIVKGLWKAMSWFHYVIGTDADGVHGDVWPLRCASTQAACIRSEFTWATKAPEIPRDCFTISMALRRHPLHAQCNLNIEFIWIYPGYLVETGNHHGRPLQVCAWGLNIQPHLGWDRLGYIRYIIYLLTLAIWQGHPLVGDGTYGGSCPSWSASKSRNCRDILL